MSRPGDTRSAAASMRRRYSHESRCLVVLAGGRRCSARPATSRPQAGRRVPAEAASHRPAGRVDEITGRATTVVTEGEVNCLSALQRRRSAAGRRHRAVGRASRRRDGSAAARSSISTPSARRRAAAAGSIPTTYLTGRLPVTATGMLHTHDGKGRFELETAEVSGIPIPKAFLAGDGLVLHAHRRSIRRASVSTSRSSCPPNIRRIDVDQGPRHRRAVTSSSMVGRRPADAAAVLKGVGPRKAADLKKAGLLTVEDLLFRFPLRYEDRSRLQPIIVAASPGRPPRSSGEVLHAACSRRAAPGFRLFTALVQDASGQMQAVWPNQAFLKDVIRPHQHIVLYGKVGVLGIARPADHRSRVRDHARDDAGGDESVERCTPAASCRSTSAPAASRTNMQRRFVWQALEQLPDGLFDPVPADMLERASAGPSRRAALQQAHFPDADTPRRRAQPRSHAGAAAADLRGFLRLPDRAGAAAAAERAGAQAAGRRRSTIASARPRARCCRSS